MPCITCGNEDALTEDEGKDYCGGCRPVTNYTKVRCPRCEGYQEINEFEIREGDLSPTVVCGVCKHSFTIKVCWSVMCVTSPAMIK